MLHTLLDHSPESLVPSGAAAEPVRALRTKYHDELVVLSAALATLRQRMLASGMTAEIADVEGELLYAAIRELRPDTVVEISPAFGYSTNYILAALTANRAGRLVSFELAGPSVEQVIRGNLLPTVETDRLEVVLGDVRDSNVPAADLLFLDSSHEDHFAAWAFLRIVPKAAWVIQHDIVLREPPGYAPKSWRLGPRESAVVLEVLAREQRPFFSPATGATYGQASALTPRLPGVDRAILYRGGDLGADARSLCDFLELVHARRREAIEGNRLPLLDFPEAPAFVERCIYGALLAEAGYTHANQELLDGFERIVPSPASTLTVPELLFYVHYLRRAVHVRALAKLALGLGPSCVNASFGRHVRHAVARELLR